MPRVGFRRAPEVEPPGRTDYRAGKPRNRRFVEANSGGSLREALDDFLELQDLAAARDADRAVRGQPQMVSRFYDVVTWFYEYAWGQSFHFAPRRTGEGLHAAQRRQESGVGELLELAPGARVADLGCGVGGPLIHLAKTTGASITGLNLNAYQIERGRRAARRAGLQETCSFLLADYLDVPLADGSFDAAYSFEAICHAPDKSLCLRELWRLVKPGGRIALTEWCLTTVFDGKDPVHRDIRDRVEFGNAVPNLPMTSEFVAAVAAAGLRFSRAGTRPSRAIRTLPGTGRCRAATFRSRRWRGFPPAVGSPPRQPASSSGSASSRPAPATRPVSSTPLPMRSSRPASPGSSRPVSSCTPGNRTALT